MARKNNTPAITHTEIYCYAIRELTREIDDWEKKTEGHPELRNNIDQVNAPLIAKREALREMYRLETGVEYDI